MTTDNKKPPASSSHPYDALTPDVVLAAVEAQQHRCSGHLLALNSYENRVYQVGLEDGGFLVAKFYRPGRWANEAILEEHAFSLALQASEVPVVAPLPDADGNSLFVHADFRYALFPRHGGHAPELGNPDVLQILGRFIGRMHLLGSARPFEHRPRISLESYAQESVHFLLQHEFIPTELLPAYQSVSDELIQTMAAAFDRAGQVRQIRLHGDFHPGNLLWTDAGPHIVDLDDCRTGPAIQDLWMLLSGDHHDMTRQLTELLEGYEQFMDFDPRELQLVEALRGMRLMHYAAWLARRWDDPAFPHNFPWFNTVRYWEEHILQLREQQALLQEPAINII